MDISRIEEMEKKYADKNNISKPIPNPNKYIDTSDITKPIENPNTEERISLTPLSSVGGELSRILKMEHMYNYKAPTELSEPQNIESLPAHKMTGAIARSVGSIPNDPSKRLDWISAFEGRDRENYGIAPNGEPIYYDPETGKNFYLYPQSNIGKIGGFIEEGIFDPSSYIGAGIGKAARVAVKTGKWAKRLASVGGDIAGTTASELGKWYIANKDDESLSSELADIAIGTGIGLGIEGGSKFSMMATKKIVDLANLPLPSQLYANTVKKLKDSGLLSNKSIREIAVNEDRFRNFGIPLNIMEKVNDTLAISKLKNINNINYTKEMMNRGNIINEYVQPWLQKVLPHKYVIPNREVKLIVENYLKDIPREKANIMRPFYEQLEAQTPIIDTMDITKQLISMIDKKNLTTDQESIFREIINELRRAKQVRSDGKNSSSFSLEFEITFEKADALKKKLDEIISGKYIDPRISSFSKNVKTTAEKIKDRLLNYFDSVNPQYKEVRYLSELLQVGESRRKYDEATGELLDLNSTQKKILDQGERLKQQEDNLKKIASIPDNEVSNLGSYVLSTKWSSPGLVKDLRTSIYKAKGKENGEKIWQSIVGNWIEYEWSNIPLARHGVEPDIGGRLWDAIAGTRRNQQMLEAALPPQNYNNIYTFLDLLRRSGMVVPRNLPAESNEKIGEEFKRGAGRYLQKIMFTRVGVYQSGEAIQSYGHEKGMEIFNSIIWSPEAAKKLNDIQRKMLKSETRQEAISDLTRVISNGIGIHTKETKDKIHWIDIPTNEKE